MTCMQPFAHILLRKLPFTKRMSMPIKRSASTPVAVEKKLKSLSVDDKLTTHCINTIRVLSADMVEKAKSGHPGAPMGCAPIAHVLFSEAMNFSPKNPTWSNRDRFVLSNGHACALQYSYVLFV